jgi:hypothetical protein
MLLDQQQYQQLENLKSKPSTPPALTPPQQQRNVPTRPTIQQTTMIPPQPKTMSSSQIRAEDTQRAMSGLM